jgi:YjbE family integral membrane protein
MGPILHALNPFEWGDLLRSGIADMGHAAFWGAVVQIVFVNIVVSGDNAVVIAMACRGLPQRERAWGIVIGAGVAVLLRLIFTGVVGRLMLLPYLKLIGGAALIYVAAKLLVRDDDDRNDVAAEAQLWRAVRIVVIADVVMSLDNVIAVAAIAQGSLILLAIGLLASIPIIIAGATLIMTVLERWPIFVWAGAALLGWIAGHVSATDPAVFGYVARTFGESVANQIELPASVATAFLVVGIGGLWRNVSTAKKRMVRE